MEQIITEVILASGLIGLVSNFSVSAIKKMQNTYTGRLSPRVANAIASLAGAFGLILSGQEADIASIENAMLVLIIAGVSWVIAHFTHKVNGI